VVKSAKPYALVRFLQWEDDATRECAMRALYNLCKGSKARQEQAAVAGAVPHLVAIASAGMGGVDYGQTVTVASGGGRSASNSGGGPGVGVVNGSNGDGAHWSRLSASATLLIPLAAPLLCDMATSSRRTRAELVKHDALDAYLSLARCSGGEFAVAAVEAIAGWLAEEPWKVEARWGLCTR
jgi:hypothetical protein